jgi:hypothetical protein
VSMSKLTLISVLLITANPTFAADSKTYSGYSCTTNNVDDNVYYHWGAAYNKSASMQRFRCAITRDAQRITGAWVKVVDWHDVQNFSCWLFAVKYGTWDIDRFPISTAVFSKDPGDAHPIQVLKFPQQINPDNIQSPWIYDGGSDTDPTSYFLECNVPGEYNDPERGIYSERSGIISYTIREDG